jgi:hypothetical protein
MYHIVTAWPSKLASCVRATIRYIEVKIYNTVIFRVGLHGCGTWSVTLREEHKLIVSENMVLVELFRVKKIAYEKLHDSFNSSNRDS